MKPAFPKIAKKIFFILVIIVSVIFTSCSPAKRIADGEYLYNKSKIEIDKKKIDKSTLIRYQRMTPNKRMLGARFHLFLYNLANPEKEKFPHSWFRKIGEAPVIYDSILLSQNNKNFTKFIADKGFQSVQVNESHIKKGKKKINVLYQFELGEPTLINTFSYHFEDTSIQKYVFADTAYSLIKAGYPFDKTLMQAERMRIEVMLKNQGYYKFSKEYIFFEYSKASHNKGVDVTLSIKQSVSGYINPVTKIRPHKRFKIDNVNIYSDLQTGEERKKYDTISFNRHNILFTEKQKIKASALVGANRLVPGTIYSLENTERTYANYSQLELFRFINVSFTEKESDEEFGKVDCNVELAMRDRQSYAFEVVATNSDNDLGVRGNITYDNYNIFKGGEHFHVGLSGAIESLENRIGATEPMRELGIVTRLETPKFLLPFAGAEFQRKYNPRTAIQFSYNNQRQPKYVRTVANASFGYTWKGNSYNRHSIYPVDFYLVKLPDAIDSAYFVDNIMNTRLENSFIDHTILGVRYGFEYSNQAVENRKSFVYLRSNLESAGLSIGEIDKRTDWGQGDSLLFGVPYFQYVRGDIDFRHFNRISASDRIVYRLFAGVGIPYGISDAMPFEKMYWAGGPYGNRAWRERSLGPGSYPDTTNNQLGDIKLEANLEYRFKMFWKLEGALFVDAGNVWLLKDDVARPGASFHLDTFIDDIAVGTGFGTRFDFSFVLIRLDFGFKLRDPSIQPDNRIPYLGESPHYRTGSKWTFKNPDVNFWDVSFQFGIGYPF